MIERPSATTRIDMRLQDRDRHTRPEQQGGSG